MLVVWLTVKGSWSFGYQTSPLLPRDLMLLRKYGDRMLAMVVC